MKRFSRPKDTFYSLYGASIRLCELCRYYEPYASINSTNAHKYFKMKSKMFQDSITDPLSRMHTIFKIRRRKVQAIYFKLTDIYKISETAFGENEVRQMIDNLRNERHICASKITLHDI